MSDTPLLAIALGIVAAIAAGLGSGWLTFDAVYNWIAPQGSDFWQNTTAILVGLLFAAIVGIIVAKVVAVVVILVGVGLSD